VSLARAVYQAADIYILDDPLSAVDAHVGKALFNNCINGVLKGKTRILVTHQLQYLAAADMVYVLKDGVVQEAGTYETLIKNERELHRLITTHVKEKEEEEHEHELEGGEPNLRQSSDKGSMKKLPEEAEEKAKASLMTIEERWGGRKDTHPLHLSAVIILLLLFFPLTLLFLPNPNITSSYN
jgi:ABC-type multidrug transport system ATPase subunit